MGKADFSSGQAVWASMRCICARARELCDGFFADLVKKRVLFATEGDCP